MKIDVLAPILISLVGTLLLTSCSSETDVNKENFANAINTVLHKRNLCFEDTDFSFPTSISAKEKNGKKLIRKLDALHSAGLLSRRVETKKIERPDLRISMHKAVRYELTVKGYNYVNTLKKEDKTFLQFCFAKPHVSEIKKFTPPKTKNGKTTTTVTYNYSITQVADWARKQSLLDVFPQVKREVDTLENPIEKTAKLVLTKERWVYEQ